jgi:hypothetical protein
MLDNSYKIFLIIVHKGYRMLSGLTTMYDLIKKTNLKRINHYNSFKPYRSN